MGHIINLLGLSLAERDRDVQPPLTGNKEVRPCDSFTERLMSAGHLLFAIARGGGFCLFP